MSDLPIERDLTPIFERIDVGDALAGHCASTHDADGIKECRFCVLLVAIIADAVVEWLAMVDLDRAALAVSQPPPTGEDRRGMRSRVATMVPLLVAAVIMWAAVVEFFVTMWSYREIDAFVRPFAAFLFVAWGIGPVVVIGFAWRSITRPERTDEKNDA